MLRSGGKNGLHCAARNWPQIIDAIFKGRNCLTGNNSNSFLDWVGVYFKKERRNLKRRVDFAYRYRQGLGDPVSINKWKECQPVLFHTDWFINPNSTPDFPLREQLYISSWPTISYWTEWQAWLEGIHCRGVNIHQLTSSRDHLFIEKISCMSH